MTPDEKKEDLHTRFTEKLSQSIGAVEATIVRDNETGVNYIFAANMASGGITVTPLLDATGEVYIDNIEDEN